MDNPWRKYDQDNSDTFPSMNKEYVVIISDGNIAIVDIDTWLPIEGAWELHSDEHVVGYMDIPPFVLQEFLRKDDEKDN